MTNRRLGKPLAPMSTEHPILTNLVARVVLLEEVSNPILPTLTVNVANPAQVHVSAFFLVGLLAARNDPMNPAIKVWREVDRPEQRFCRNEPNGGRNLP